MQIFFFLLIRNFLVTADKDKSIRTIKVGDEKIVKREKERERERDFKDFRGITKCWLGGKGGGAKVRCRVTSDEIRGPKSERTSGRLSSSWLDTFTGREHSTELHRTLSSLDQCPMESACVNVHALALHVCFCLRRYHGQWFTNLFIDEFVACSKNLCRWYRQFDNLSIIGLN